MKYPRVWQLLKSWINCLFVWMLTYVEQVDAKKYPKPFIGCFTNRACWLGSNVRLVKERYEIRWEHDNGGIFMTCKTIINDHDKNNSHFNFGDDSATTTTTSWDVSGKYCSQNLSKQLLFTFYCTCIFQQYICYLYFFMKRISTLFHILRNCWECMKYFVFIFI